MCFGKLSIDISKAKHDTDLLNKVMQKWRTVKGEK